MGAALRQARLRPVAVLSHNSPAFYMLEPRLYEALLDALADRQLEQTVLSRLAERTQAIEVDIDTV